MQEFKLPDLGEGMHEAEIRRWLVRVGETIKAYQPMVEVETDKAVVEIPAPMTARVAEIRVPEGQVAQKGEILITFETAGNGAGPVPAAGDAAAPAPAEATSSSAPRESAQPAAAPEPARRRVLAAPAVRKLAFELGVDLAQVTPSAPGGRVTIDDVRAYAERNGAAAQPAAPSSGAPTAPPAPPAVPETARSAPTVQEERQPLTGLRRRIAERMELSWRTIPHATSFDEADGRALVELRRALLPVAEQRGVHLTYLPLLLKLLLPVLK